MDRPFAVTQHHGDYYRMSLSQHKAVKEVNAGRETVASMAALFAVKRPTYVACDPRSVASHCRNRTPVGITRQLFRSPVRQPQQAAVA